MARPLGGGDDNVTQLDEENLVAAGTHTGWIAPRGRFNVTISGTFVAQLVISRSFDGGTTAVPCGALGAPVVYTTPVSEQLEHSGEANVLYRVDMIAFTSGSAHVRLSQ